MTLIEPGSVIDGKYRVLRQIGTGGMGTVYEGENIRIERKVLRYRLGQEDPGDARLSDAPVTWR